MTGISKMILLNLLPDSKRLKVAKQYLMVFNFLSLRSMLTMLLTDKVHSLLMLMTIAAVWPIVMFYTNVVLD